MRASRFTACAAFTACTRVRAQIASIGAGLIGRGAASGFCLYGATQAAYFAGYAPLLYATFLASFFRNDDVDLDLYYYSEMSEAGFLDGAADDPFVALAP